MAIKFIRRMKSFDRRRYPRLSLSCIAKYHVEGAKQADRLPTNILNLSEGGVLLVAFKEKMPDNSKITLQFQLPGRKEIIEAAGIVKNTIARRKNFFESCIMFTGLRDDQKKVIQEFISSRLKSQTKKAGS
jgi:c-di-GMP-binding flagellar brake protein YcgR